jgi:UDP-hydrolysing UDP-N-acetyl-D-glucosamine 2-epimerase
LLAACGAALISKVPIVHIHGGEVTEGAVDEKVRHAVSKMADVHFTSTEEYRRRVIQMGESPSLVFNCGALGLEHLTRHSLYTLEALAGAVSPKLTKGFFLVLYHPETIKNEEDISDLIRVLKDYENYHKVMIYPNSDNMSQVIIKKIEEYGNTNPSNVTVLKSVERLTYLSLVKHCDILVGNSSSGIIEAPSLGCAVVNIGDRQKGRIRSKANIDVEMDYDKLKRAFKLALSEPFKIILSRTQNPYDQGYPSKTILKWLCDSQDETKSKKFFNLEFEI